MTHSLDELSDIQKGAFRKMMKQTDIWVQHTVSKLEDDFEQIMRKHQMTADSVLCQLNRHEQRRVSYQLKNDKFSNWRKIKSYSNVFQPPCGKSENRSIQSQNRSHYILNLITKNVIFKKLRLSNCLGKQCAQPQPNIEQQAVSLLSLESEINQED